MNQHFAGHGYVGVRLDVRGIGDSEGILRDEYVAQEQDDAEDATEWLTRQPWCNGSVGMIGLSWSGINALQVAARRPPGLKAIITMCSTDDRYADDAHYKGGCLLNEIFGWGSALFSLNACPPDPEIAGESWREQWHQRLTNNQLFPALWMQHPHRDDYWQHGSVCEDFSVIDCAVYAVSGWSDGYVNAVPRLLEALDGPRKGLIGPWPHAFPHAATPGPRIGFFQEAVRWWDYWLKGIDTGIMDELTVRVWMEDWAHPAPSHDERPGRWVAEEQWPSPRIHRRRWYLNVLALGDQPGTADSMRVRSPQTTGLKGGDFYGFGSEGDAPLDQREDDGCSLAFDSDPLTERIEIFGAPVVNLAFSVDQPIAHVAVRLNDVAPDGSSARVSYETFNLSHRDSHEHPEALEPGKRYVVPIQLNDIAYAFAPGHTIRVAISTSYWPMIWPDPAPVELTVYAGASSLDLPVRPPREADAELAPFPEPERGPEPSHTPLEMTEPQRTIETDLTTDETIYTVFGDSGDFGGAALARIDDIDLTLGYTMEKVFRIGQHDPLTASATIDQKTTFQRGDWSVRIECLTALTADADHFYVYATQQAFEGDTEVDNREWNEKIPRRLL